MKTTNISKGDNDLITIETETERSFLLFKLKPLKRTFVANREYPTGYWAWLELPNKSSVSDGLSFQLSEWVRFDLKARQ